MQASDITGGLYIRVPEPEALLQYLLVTVLPTSANIGYMCIVYSLFQWVFLPDTSTQKMLNLPLPQKVDYRAACFCHHQLVEIGHVCSVCLASESNQSRCTLLLLCACHCLSCSCSFFSFLSLHPDMFGVPVSSLLSGYCDPSSLMSSPPLGLDSSYLVTFLRQK